MPTATRGLIVKIARTADTTADALQTEWFDGTGTRQDVTRIDAPSAGVTVVTFEPGARTHWHRHSDGQVLFVLDGSGRTATRTEPEVPIEPGDVVYVGPDEEHWHGATASGAMRHVALSFGTTVWLESAVDGDRVDA
jgi:quercetin dioxygenase-like cupin family protein